MHTILLFESIRLIRGLKRRSRISPVTCLSGEYARVPDFVIEEIRRNLEIINANGNKKPQRFKSGDVVEIRSKPFDKYQAIFDSHIPGRERVRVLLQLLNDRQISVELSPEEIELKN